MNSDQIIVAYANISAGVNCNFLELAQLHSWFKAQGCLFRQDVAQLASRGIPLHHSAAKLFGLNINIDILKYDAYLQCLEDMTKEGGQLCKLINL